MSSSKPKGRPQVDLLDPLTAHERLQRDFRQKYGGDNNQWMEPPKRATKSELDVLKEHHQFIRSNDVKKSELTWEDKLAQKYYESLFREYAVVDLSRYKTGAIALRWRTESEVLSGVAHLTCGSLHCRYHASPSSSLTPEFDPDSTEPLVPTQLNEFEVPFSYVELGDKKKALVKLVLCRKCGKKLLYSRKKKDEVEDEGEGEGEEKNSKSHRRSIKRDSTEVSQNHSKRKRNRSRERSQELLGNGNPESNYDRKR